MKKDHVQHKPIKQTIETNAIFVCNIYHFLVYFKTSFKNISE